MSKCAVPFRTSAITYRCQEDQSLLQISQILYLFVADAIRYTLDEQVELLKSSLAEDGLDDMVVDLQRSVLAQATLLACCGYSRK